MSEWNNAYGFYANKETALSVLKRARARGLRRSALLNKKSRRAYAPSDALIAWSLVLLIGVPTFHYAAHEVLWKHLPLFILALAGLLGWWIGDLIRFHIPSSVLKKAESWIIGDENLVFIQVQPERVAEALTLLREVESGHPVSFLIRPERFTKESENEEVLIQEPYNPEQVEELAKRLANEFKGAKVKRGYKVPLLKNLKASSRILSQIRHDVSEAEHLEQTITASAEWLLDNSYVIQGNIEEVQRNLPKKFYQDLPKISGLPRIYFIAKEMIRCSANKLTRENITAFLNSYQSVDPLTIGELWALPLIMRLRLIENIEYLSHDIDRRISEGESASFWGNRLLTASRRDPQQLESFMNTLKKECDPTPHFAEELFDHLFDEEKVLPMVRSWIEETFHTSLGDVIHGEQIKRTVEQVAFSSAIVSLIALSQVSWREVFESVCVVDKILDEDPDGTYAKMDFFTRDIYRKEVEKLSKGSNQPETYVARETVEQARRGDNSVNRHVGYYLIDKGRPVLEEDLHFKPTFSQSIQRFLLKHPTSVYLGGIVLFTALLVGLLAMHTNSVVLWLLALIPASEVVIQLYNLLLSRILPPFVLPKMKFEKGVPEDRPTLVIIPTMLSGKAAIKENTNRLEVHYLANTDPGLRFGLLVDFIDAKTAQTEHDLPLLEYTLNGIKWLEERYGKDKFFLFYRDRVYSPSEGAWIGWERKRGKLEALNRFLVEGEHAGIILKWGNRERLRGIQYVITLDSDTQLPKDTARQLVATLVHPLNQPKIADGKIERGYTLIQPKMSTNYVHSQLTLFSYIFADEMSVDPYTSAISNVYQDLMQEGTYHGKGIYEVKAFHELLTNRFPEEYILSHDLIEGIYGRVGFASDVNLLDTYPKDYLTWAKRQHRWIRGDWQITDWLFNKVPNAFKQQVQNLLSTIDRWKIFDNLRRSLLPTANFLILLYGWFFSEHPPFWTLFVMFTIFMPTLSMFLANAFTDPRILVMSKDQFINSLLRSIVTVAMLPHQAYLTIDAIVKVAYRRLISKKKMLEWLVSYYSGKHKKQIFIFSLFSVSLLAACLGVALISVSSAWPIVALWFFSPLVIYILDRSTTRDLLEKISQEDKQFIRNVARKTWRFFDNFVGPNTHWLPPDNFQSSLVVEVAERTSPTNIGLYLLSTLGAYDFRYITCDALLDRLILTFETFKKLEQHEGHLLNWYETKTLRPLHPRYVSTVDSGNFLASLWALEQGVYDMLSEPILPMDLLNGIHDDLHQMIEKCNTEEERKSFKPFHHILHEPIKNFAHLIEIIQRAKTWIDYFATPEHVENTGYGYWVQQIQKEIAGWDDLIQRYFSWIEIHPVEKWTYSLRDFATGRVAQELNLDNPALKERLDKAQWLAGEKMGQARTMIDAIHEMSKNMNMSFLYNYDRKLFSIGFNVEEHKLDNSYYDLLASEARIASLVSIAKDDVPLDHWWALSRSYRFVDGRQVLMSWGGTMFEYLMPLIFNNYFRESLLGEACTAAVEVQMNYGKRRGIPWGISESAFSEIDIRRIYQYRSFGVPGLGFKQGLEDDLVVSPYSSALALAVFPRKAIENLRRLHLLSTYGYYESIDYARQLGPHGERGVPVFAYFAHHQGMAFLSFNNLLNHNIVAKRFHSNPRISGIEPLLLEKVPIYPPIAKGFRSERPITRLTPISQQPIMGLVDTPHSTTPKLNLLSNGQLSIMTTNAGGGYTRWKDFDVTRWYADSTCDFWGNYVFIQDLTSGNVWSNAYHPLKSQGKQYSVTFKADKTEIKRRDHDIETITEIVVSPEDDAEIRLLTIANLSKEKRTLQFTSYSELALAPHAADRAHPVFNKMFIETESVGEFPAILGYRRLRSPNDTPIWSGQVVASSSPFDTTVEWETDRGQFIGRGHTLENPVALDKPLSGTTGTVLDPILSLRAKITLKPGERIQISFVTVISESKEKTVNLIKKYADISASHRALDLAWTHSQLELRHLRIQQEEAQLFQKLAGRILYPHGQLRPTTDQLRRNKLGQSSLWAYSISGDLPIIVVAISDPHDIDLVKQVVTAHAFLRMRGLKVDLVILNEEGESYEHPLYHQVVKLVQSYSHLTEMNKPGGVFVLNADQIPPDDLTLLLSVSRANLIAARGYLRQQLVSPVETTKYGPRLLPDRNVKDFPSPNLPFWDLADYNGFGGFTYDGKEYVIYLDGSKNTPAPWINVMANAQFGTIVTESGIGTSWFGNSQMNRLTPWTNDPLLNPVCDTIYIRDDQLGTFWTLTPSPIRESEAYRVRFGQGYTHFEHNSHGLEQELTIFVPPNKAMRIQIVRIKNSSDRKRSISLFGYLEWVLGTTREQTEMHVITEWDPEAQAIFAINHYNSDFKDYIAYAACNPLPTSFTANRTEFIGRNHHASGPYAMRRKTLSGTTGAALDPCAALQVHLELEPGETKEVTFILGYAPSEEAARADIAEMRNQESVNKLLHTTAGYWDNILNRVQVETPDRAVNFALNRWLLYQVLSCRYWGRSAFYQSSGAFGFRDQLQDVMALLHTAPEIAREHILDSASHQFVEGDVQHWWHPPSNGGVRTRISDDLLWLPYVTAQYVRVTGDRSILDVEVPFIKGDLLRDDQEEAYFIPEVSEEKATLLEHCRRALHKGMTSGPHGLPLIGTGDWNDGMNLVGVHGKGESVWLGWFLIQVMNDFAELSGSDGFRAEAKRLSEQLEAQAWDGSWYKRAYFDDGTPLGSKENVEDTIDSLPQSWAVISGGGDLDRAKTAMKSVEEHLVKPDHRMVDLLTPPFNTMVPDPGYIKGYPPGVRENGGQYTHGSLWVPLAFARLGEGDKAFNLIRMMQPMSHTENPEAVAKYKVEPYVVVADVYSLPTKLGQGGWSWYTGAAGWMYRIYLEEILGFKVRGDKLTLKPVLPSHWDKVKIIYLYKNTPYTIEIERVAEGKLYLDGQEVAEVSLKDDGQPHLVAFR